jgi:hypothetical protein
MSIRSERFNLHVIDQAYGPYADLYVDVLRVSYLASDKEIQAAFFERRSEIFTILSKLKSGDDSENDEIALSQRRFAERRLDAVVMAFRVLKGPESRKAYEKERERRIASRLASSVRSISDSPSPVTEMEQGDVLEGMDSVDGSVCPSQMDETISVSSRSRVRGADSSVETYAKHPRKPRAVRSPRATPSPRGVPRRTDDSISRDATQVSTDESGRDLREERSDRETSSHQDSIGRIRRRRKRHEGVIERKSETSLVRTIADEVHGAYLDTITAFDQVFNAFTLQEQDIMAVCGRIETAKKQLVPDDKRS